MSKETGGPAFPFQCQGPTTAPEFYYGMSLLDYFAVHSTQPGVVEVAKAAGVGIDTNHRVYLTEDAKAGISFNDWWISLTLERQCELSAAVRYAEANAMLKERSKWA